METKIYYENKNHKKTGGIILVSDKSEFNMKILLEIKKDIYEEKQGNLNNR